MHAGVIIFPGSNCDRDSITVLEQCGFTVSRLWHGDADIPSDMELVVLPGGFSYGDYLRCGAMAAHSPIMQSVIQFAGQGKYVLGICNGFQMLCETGLLPGALMRNLGLSFLCKEVSLRVETAASPFTKQYTQGQILNVPIAHFDGNYYATDDALKLLNDNDQVAFRYCHTDGTMDERANPNGSAQHIAGILNASRNVLGMMPHPERHSESILGGLDGKALFEGLLAA